MTSQEDCKERLEQAEGVYTPLLKNVEGYQVLDNQLELVTLKGEVIVFERLGKP